MTSADDTTPLFCLDAAVLDTETTGLDPASARLVEVAAVRVARGRLVETPLIDGLVDPGEPMPAAAEAVHGIGDAALAGAPPAGAVIDALIGAVGATVLIGHAIGFDLAVIRAERARAGLPEWVPARVLDTRLLAQIAEPRLGGYSLDQLAAWLGVEPEVRHRALGDARTTARVFIALAPRLRERGIRTLAEAEAACRKLTAVLDQHHRAGWVEPVASLARRDAERTLARIDPYAFRHQVRELMSAPPVFAAPDAPLGEALELFAERQISSVFVEDDGGTGIVTERDAMRAVAARGAAALQTPLRALMRTPLITVPADAHVYRALGRMNRRRIRHLGVADETGRLVGALSMRDLLRLRAQEAVNLGDAVELAEDVADLGRAWGMLPAVADALVRAALPGREVAAVISRELGALTGRAAQLAEAELAAEGLGPPPRPYAVLILGSAARGESLLAMDQDNALVFADGPEPDEAVDPWFARLGARLAEILHAVGVPRCKGGVMASNPAFRGSVATWRGRSAEWVRRARPEDLLNVDIFFDLRAVHGDATLAAAILDAAFDEAGRSVAFAKLMAEEAAVGAPFTLFGGLREDEAGRVNLKAHGLFPIVAAARAIAVRHGIRERATPARLAAARALRIGSEQDLVRLDEAHALLVERVLAQQIADVGAGVPPSNGVPVRTLPQRERVALRGALRAAAGASEVARELVLPSG